MLCVRVQYYYLYGMSDSIWMFIINSFYAYIAMPIWMWTIFGMLCIVCVCVSSSRIEK